MVKQGLMGNKVIADGIYDFPGTFDKSPDLENISVELASDGLRRHQATGCYLPAGAIFGSFMGWKSNPLAAFHWSTP